MSKTTYRLLSILPLILFASNEFIRSYIRPQYGRKEYGTVSQILGWLPNLIAAWGIIALGASILILVDNNAKTPLSPKRKFLLLVAITTVALAGLLAHEVMQTGTGLHYDIADIYATVAGAFTGFAGYYLMLIKVKPQARTPSIRQ